MTERKNRTTIYDIAKLADTSVATVSRVLSGSGYPVSPPLKQKIFKIAERLNYSPNRVARSLKSNISPDIGVIIPTVSNPFYSSVILGIEEEVNQNGCYLLLCNTFRDIGKEKRYLQSLYEKQIRGVLISSLGYENIGEYAEKGMQFVLMDQKIENNDFSMVSFDCFRGAYLAVEYLIRNGHRKIAFISSPLTKWTRKEMYKGYRTALSDYGIPQNEESILIGTFEKEEEEGFEFQNGKRMADEFTKRKLDATAVLTVNDMTAFGFIQRMNVHGKRVPQDLSVIGFDDISFAGMFSPPLTTIRYPGYEVGKSAAKLLLEKLDGRSESNRVINLLPELIARGSVRSLKKST